MLSLLLIFSAIWEIPRKCNKEQILRIRGEFNSSQRVGTKLNLPTFWEKSRQAHESSAFMDKNHISEEIPTTQSRNHRMIKDGKDLLDQHHTHIPYTTSTGMVIPSSGNEDSILSMKKLLLKSQPNPPHVQLEAVSMWIRRKILLCEQINPCHFRLSWILATLGTKSLI